MKPHHLLLPLLAALTVPGFSSSALQPFSLSAPDLVFAEKDGIITGEAEHFTRQTLAEKRAWHLTSVRHRPDLRPDADATHVLGASGGAYLEILPDTRVSNLEPLVRGENFHDEPGQLAVLTYPIYVTTPGRYHVWCRIFSTGTDDNGLHVGLDGQWPASGRRWQTVLKNAWLWDSRQRTPEVHVGVPGQLYLDIPTPGLHTFQISMREDGTELDKWLLTRDPAYVPAETGPAPVAHSGQLPAPIPVSKNYVEGLPPAPANALVVRAADLKPDGTGYYLDQNRWLAIDPAKAKTATLTAPLPTANGRYDVTLYVVGEADGQSTYTLTLGNHTLEAYTSPLSSFAFEEGAAFSRTWRNIDLNEGTNFTITSTIASADGKEWSRGRWAQLVFTLVEGDPGREAADRSVLPAKPDPTLALVQPRQPAGDAALALSGELRQWHAVTLDLAGPYAHENDNQPNPFTDYSFFVIFRHESGSPVYTVPGYFAADGRAAETSATSGTTWRAHLSPDKPGRWSYTISFLTGPRAAIEASAAAKPLAPYHGKTGAFTIAPSDKTGRDFRAHGRLAYNGTRYLHFAATGQPFLKAGTDSPETLLATVDFDNTQALKKNVPLKTWAPHLSDARPGDPTWKNGRGKALFGALNYLAAKGLNTLSFLTYNPAGDGDNIWPFVHRDDKFHYDCSKLDQWGLVFTHAQTLGLHLHFKLQENELDDNRLTQKRTPGLVPESLDGGLTGPERKLYLRELIARYAHHLALLWNLGEENTQSTEEQVSMANYIAATDPYRHNLVLHTFPGQQDSVYTPVLGPRFPFTGASLQNPWDHVHQRTLQWIQASAAAGHTWVVCNDEQNPAAFGVPADPTYPGASPASSGDTIYTHHDIRKYTLWGNLMAGGAGVEYLFGYKNPHNDLLCEDFRSRDQTWDYCRHALEFFAREKLPLLQMASHDALIGNPASDNSKYCFAQPGHVYLVYLPNGGADTALDLSGVKGNFALHWYNPRAGGPLVTGPVTKLSGGAPAKLGAPPADPTADWLAVIRATP